MLTGTLGLDVTGDIRNEATVTLPRGETDPNPADNRVEVITPGTPLPDLGIVKSAVPVASFFPGDPLTYLLRVTNHGEAAVPAGGMPSATPCLLNSRAPSGPAASPLPARVPWLAAC